MAFSQWWHAKRWVTLAVADWRDERAIESDRERVWGGGGDEPNASRVLLFYAISSKCVNMEWYITVHNKNNSYRRSVYICAFSLMCWGHTVFIWFIPYVWAFEIQPPRKNYYYKSVWCCAVCICVDEMDNLMIWMSGVECATILFCAVLLYLTRNNNNYL